MSSDQLRMTKRMKRYLKSFTSLEKIVDTIKAKKRNYLKKGGGCCKLEKFACVIKAQFI